MKYLRVSVVFILQLFCAISAENIKRFTFPKEFIFGAATASYQIEGAWNVDGKIPSIWDTATHREPNGVFDGSTGDDAAKSYIFYEKDIQALKDINAKMYRFSVAWTRVLTKDMEVNEAGIEYYNKLINALIREGIEPMLTIYHWDLPQWIQDIGGWMNADIIQYYKFYADLIFSRFGDRVKKFITLNEPTIFCYLGYDLGIHAPHLTTKHNIGAYTCIHHVLLANAAAYRLYKEKYYDEQKGQVGICFHNGFKYPKNKNVTSQLVERVMQFYLGHVAHPIFSENGDYPEVMRQAIDEKSKAQGRSISRLPKFTSDQIESLKGSADFLAFNYYTSEMAAPISENPNINPIDHDTEFLGSFDPDWKRAKTPWLHQVPQGLYDILNWIKREYDNPVVYVTENGWSDAPLQVEDDDRVEYLSLHLAAIAKAVEDGCNVKGYTYWSLIDNFEWMSGYNERFGLFAIDSNDPERKRIPKKSVEFYAEVAKSKHVDADEDKMFVVKKFQ